VVQKLLGKPSVQGDLGGTRMAESIRLMTLSVRSNQAMEPAGLGRVT